MSIASNVIDENNRLGTVRALLREKLTRNGVSYKDSDSIAILLKRWAYTRFAGSSSISFPYDYRIREGNEVKAGVIIKDNDNNPVEGVPADIIINGVSYEVFSNSDGEAMKTFTVGNAGDELEISVVSGVSTRTENYTIKSFEFTDNDIQATYLYDVVKYPADLTHSFSTYKYDSSYSGHGYLISKGVAESSAVMLFPTIAIDTSKTGVHFSAKMVQKKNSDSGWGDAIAFVSSKNLSHYRDTKILELGAYPSSKGLKYSNEDHTINELSVTSGQLSLNSVWYTFDIYYDDGYLIATIYNGSTEVFSYEGDISDVIGFDTFYPVIMVYDYGGAMLFNNVLIEPWSND